MFLGVWFHHMLGKFSATMLGLMTLWSMGVSIQNSQAQFIHNHIHHSFTSTYAAVDVQPDLISSNSAPSFETSHEESTLIEGDDSDPEGHDDDPSPPWTPLIAHAVTESIAWVPALSQVLNAEVDLFKRRWRLLSAPARSPPTASQPEHTFAVIG